MSETSLFIQKFIQSPMQVGSVFPSSSFLGRKMAQSVDWNQVSLAVELGAGTGVITDHLIRSKQPDCELHVFEKDTEMRERLRQRLSGCFFYEDAQSLTESITASSVNHHVHADVVFSCLPFANFPHEVRERILSEVLNVLKPGGIFVAFQYSLQMKKMLTNVFDDVKISFVPLNFPPAFVYTCIKK